MVRGSGHSHTFTVTLFLFFHVLLLGFRCSLFFFFSLVDSQTFPYGGVDILAFITLHLVTGPDTQTRGCFFHSVTIFCFRCFVCSLVGNLTFSFKGFNCFLLTDAHKVIASLTQPLLCSFLFLSSRGLCGFFFKE